MAALVSHAPLLLFGRGTRWLCSCWNHAHCISTPTKSQGDAYYCSHTVPYACFEPKWGYHRRWPLLLVNLVIQIPQVSILLRTAGSKCTTFKHDMCDLAAKSGGHPCATALQLAGNGCFDSGIAIRAID